MECQLSGYASWVNFEPFGTYKEAFRILCLLSGYQEDSEEAKGDDEGLEISRILTISTAHISPRTAGLMDMDAIHEEDVLVLGASAYTGEDDIHLTEITVSSARHWCGRQVCERNLPRNALIIRNRRAGEILLSNGNTQMLREIWWW